MYDNGKKSKRTNSPIAGTVWTARCKFSGEVVAVKRMAFTSQPKKEMLLTEIKVMQQYRHKVVALFYLLI